MFYKASIVYLVAAALGACASASTLFGSDEAEWMLRRDFGDFKQKFKKVYQTVQEEEERFQIFKNNMKDLIRLSMESKSSVFGVTKFFDITQEEFEAQYLNYKPSPKPEGVTVARTRLTAPSSFDWRDQGKVTAVKDQGGCGSCWAFSATETIESAWAIAGNPLTEFSPQQVVSCDGKSAGCGGGFTENAFDYVTAAGGLATEAAYPYTSGEKPYADGKCLDASIPKSGGSISGYTYATTPCKFGPCTGQDENTMAANLAQHQPLAICVDASSWSKYTGGIMKSSDCSSRYLKQNHCVQAVGFKSIDSNNGYWIVRNSWAEDWGEDGYIYLEYGSNTCGVADDAIMVNIA